MSQEIKDFFMEEAEELFDGLNSILLRNEEAGELTKEELDSLFRNVHTLKGGAGSVELTKFSAYTHHLETFMDMVRNGEIALSRDIIEFLIDGIGEMQDILQEEYEESLDEEEYAQKMQQLISDIDVLKSGGSLSENSALSAKEKESNEKKEALDFGENAAELVDLFEEISIQLTAIKNQEIDAKDALGELFRHIHTLKGSSQFLDLVFFPQYVHEIETILDSARNGDIPYTDTFNNFMESALEKAKEVIDKELNQALDQGSFEEELEELKGEIGELLFALEHEEDKTAAEPAPFELFDEAPQSQKSDTKDPVPFELFDETTSSQQAPAFELFDENSASKEQTKTPKSEEQSTPSLPSQSAKNVKVNEAQKKAPSGAKKGVSLNKAAASTSIRVNLDKIDQLMNRVGDLVITKSMLFQFAESITDAHTNKEIFEKLTDLDRDIRELQESVMSVRMVPMESVYSRLPKMVRDLAKKLGKKIKFEHIGDNVEIDKMMVEGLMDPLTHIIRNSLDHGVEKPEVRYKKGKSETGKLIISAAQESGNIVISIIDDGAGINVEKVVSKAIENGVISHDDLSRMTEQDKLMLVFNPGLSTAEKVTDVSGRGVGMDVVMNNITALGGHIKVYSKKDKGTEFQIILPLTLAILDGLNVLIGDKKFILPLNAIVESLQPKSHMIKHVGETNKELLMLRHEFIPIVRLYEFFNIEPTYKDLEEGMLIIVKTANAKVALFVDDFLNQEQIVVKSLEKNYKKIQSIGAATIRGDGSIGLILDVTSIVDIENKKEL